MPKSQSHILSNQKYHLKRIQREGSLKDNEPELCKEWDFQKNERTPDTYLTNSNLIVWWKCSKGHSWETKISNRVNGSGCLYCKSKKVGYGNDFQSLYPELSNYWHDEKNGEKKPSEYLPKSNKKFWWKCDEGHEWEQSLTTVVGKKGIPCPFCSGSKVGYGNDLKSKYPELSKEWHPTKNKNYSPEKIFYRMTREFWWICNKKHEWKTSPLYRIEHNSGCVYCSGKIVGYGNDLESLHPELMKEWNFKKNGNQHPNMYRPGSNVRVWWMCSEGHEYEQSIGNRVSRNIGCPYCGGKRIGYGNDFETLRPHIAKEWDYDKNGKHKPSQFTEYSGKKFWWKDVFGHSWESTISDRSMGHGCPFCTNQSSEFEIFILSELEWVFGKVEQRKRIDGNEVDIYLPSINLCIEIDGSHWHKDKRVNDKKKNIFLESLGYTIIRLRDKPLKKISDDDIIISFTKDKIVSIEILLNHLKEKYKLTKVVQKNIDKWLKQKVQQNPNYYNKLLSYLPGPPPEKSLQYKFPDISKEWNHNKNGDLKPFHLTPFSKKKVWWKCSKGHEYDAVVGNRTGKRKSGCPYCSNTKVGYGNDLKTKFPQISKEWHPTKNGNLLPENFAPFSNKKVWWICKKGHEFDTEVSSRTSNELGCPYCSGHRIGYGNDLYSLYPKLMKEWNFNKNKLDPKKIRPHTMKKVWWICPKNHEYKSLISNRVKVKSGTKCPYCTNQKAGYGNSLFDRYPEVSKQWHPTKNGDLTPKDVFPSTSKKYWWRCKNGHEWEQSTFTRTNSKTYCKKCDFEERSKLILEDYKDGLNKQELKSKYIIGQKLLNEILSSQK